MPRPRKCRWITYKPELTFFKPEGVPLRALEIITLTLDEIEAIRLADYEGLYQEEAAERMKVSRQTFGNIVSSARKKIADAIINGKAIKIEGGVVSFNGTEFVCRRCGKILNIPFENDECPECRKKRGCY